METKQTESFPFGQCSVCGDTGTGVHYGAVTCEGCKGFFKRSLSKSHLYKCSSGNGCVISPLYRNRCKYCRFQKCIYAGMSLQGIKMGRIPKVIKMTALKKSKIATDFYNEPVENMRTGCNFLDSHGFSFPSDSYALLQTRSKPPLDAMVQYNKGDHNLELPCTRPLGAAKPNNANIPVSSTSSQLHWNTKTIHILMEHVIENVDSRIIQLKVVDQFLNKLNQSKFKNNYDNCISAWISVLANLSNTCNFDEMVTQCTTQINEENHLCDSDCESPRSCISRNSSPDFCQIERFHENHEDPITMSSITSRLLIAYSLVCYQHLVEISTFEKDIIEDRLDVGIVNPENPRAHPDEVKLVWQNLIKGVSIWCKMMSNFVVHIPGFRQIDVNLQRIIQQEGIYDFWMLLNYQMFRNGEFHGKLIDGRKYCRYWMQHFLPQFLIDLFFQFANRLMSLNLRESEFSILLVVRLTRPELHSELYFYDLDKLKTLHTFYTNLLYEEIRQFRPIHGEQCLQCLKSTLQVLDDIVSHQKQCIGATKVDAIWA